MPEVVSFARALTDAAEHGIAAVLLCDVIDQLHDDDGLADAGSTEQSDLSALRVWAEQVDDLDAGLEHLHLRRLIGVQGCGSMNRPVVLGVNRPFSIHRLPYDVKNPP